MHQCIIVPLAEGFNLPSSLVNRFLNIILQQGDVYHRVMRLLLSLA